MFVDQRISRATWAAIALIASLAVTVAGAGDAHAYETRVVKTLAHVDSALVAGSNCPNFFVNDCFNHQTKLAQQDGMMFQVPFNLGPKQKALAGVADVYLLSIDSGATSGAVGDVLSLDIKYSYTQNAVIVTRNVYTKGGTTKPLDYTLLDQLSEISTSVAHHKFLRAYISADMLWLEVFDVANPFFSRHRVSPTFFGAGQVIMNKMKTANGGVVTTAASIESADKSSVPMPYYTKVGSSEQLLMYRFDVAALVKDINDNYSQAPFIAPLLEQGQLAPALNGVIGGY